MKNISKISVWLLLFSSLILSLAVMQKFLKLNLFFEKYEEFVFSLLLSLGILTISVFLAAIISELSEIRKELNSINNEKTI